MGKNPRMKERRRGSLSSFLQFHLHLLALALLLILIFLVSLKFIALIYDCNQIQITFLSSSPHTRPGFFSPFCSGVKRAKGRDFGKMLIGFYTHRVPGKRCHCSFFREWYPVFSSTLFSHSLFLCYYYYYYHYSLRIFFSPFPPTPLMPRWKSQGSK